MCIVYIQKIRLRLTYNIEPVVEAWARVSALLRSIPHAGFFWTWTLLFCAQIMLAGARVQAWRLFDGLNLPNLLNCIRSYLRAHFAMWRGSTPNRPPVEALELIQRLLNRVKDWTIEVVSGKVSFRLLPLFQTKKTCASEYLNLFEIRTSTYSAYNTLVGISEGFFVGCLSSHSLGNSAWNLPT